MLSISTDGFKAKRIKRWGGSDEIIQLKQTTTYTLHQLQAGHVATLHESGCPRWKSGQ